MMKAEQENLLNNLRRDLRASTEVREALLKKTTEAESRCAKAEATVAQLSLVAEQVSVLQAAVEDKSAIVKRLTAEAQANIAQHAVRTGDVYTSCTLCCRYSILYCIYCVLHLPLGFISYSMYICICVY